MLGSDMHGSKHCSSQCGWCILSYICTFLGSRLPKFIDLEVHPHETSPSMHLQSEVTTSNTTVQPDQACCM